MDFLLPSALLFLHKAISFFSFQFCTIVNLKCRFKIFRSWMKNLFASTFRVLSWRWSAPLLLRTFTSELCFLWSSISNSILSFPLTIFFLSSCISLVIFKIVIQCPLPSGISSTNWETSEISTTLFSMWQIFSFTHGWQILKMYFSLECTVY